MLEGYDKRKIGGCFAFGCLLSVVLFSLGGLGAYFGVKTLIDSAVYKYTEPYKRELPRVYLSAQESLDVTDKVEQFADALSRGETDESLELSARDVNYLISNSNEPLSVELRDKVFVEFEDGKIKTEISVPLDQAGIKDLQGRYLNGSAEIALGMDENGELEIDLRTIDANGFQIPDAALQAFKSQTDIMNRILTHPRFAKYKKFIENVDVSGDILTLKLKKGEDLEGLRRQISRENL
jgi:hypothetical protein